MKPVRLLTWIILGFLSLGYYACFKWENPVDPDVEIDKAVQISVESGTYHNPFYVFLEASGGSGLEIRYTLDESDPNASSTLYRESLLIDIPLTLKAALVADQNISQISTAVYEMKVAEPISSLESGAFDHEQSLHLSCLTEAALIYYTLDSTEPTQESSLYSGTALILQGTTTLKLRAFREGWSPSEIAEYHYEFSVAEPTFNPAPGTFNIPPSVTILCSTSEASIHYTLDGSEPQQSSTAYTQPFIIDQTRTIKARAFKQGWPPSNTASAIYNLQVAAPTFSPGAGFYTNAQNVTLSCATAGSTIRYTLDGSEPSSSSTLYEAPIQVSNNTTIKAKAFKPNWTASETGSAEYGIMVASPSVSPVSGTYLQSQQITMSCVTENSTIRYTTDGSEPTASSTLYSSPILLPSGAINLKVKAFRQDWSPSATVSSNYVIISDNMIFVEGGNFSNGTSSVTLSGFYLDRHEVTQGDYALIMGATPNTSFGSGSNYPVYGVSWFKAIEYCNRKSIREGLTPCYAYNGETNPNLWPMGWNSVSSNHTNITCDWSANGYRLPTEMEWMFAARGGNLSSNYQYSGHNLPDPVSWHSGNSNNSTWPVGEKVANELGFKDMSGNAYEWVWDIHGIYPSGSQFNPTGPATGTQRVRRGGSWNMSSDLCKIDNRSASIPTVSTEEQGFRICLGLH